MSLKNPVTPPGADPGTVRLVAQRLKHYATPGPTVMIRDPFNTILVKPIYRATLNLHDWYSTDSIIGSRRNDRNHA